MKFEKPKQFHHKFLLMLLLVAIAYFVRVVILPIDGRVIFSTFYPAIALTALLCGYRMGFVSLGLSGFLAYFYFLQPSREFKYLDFEDATALATYIFSAAIICLSFSHFSNEASSKIWKPKKSVSKISLMLLLVGFAFFLRISLLPVDSRVIYSTFYPAIALATLFCGFRVGLIGMFTAGFLSYFYLLPPFQSFKQINFEQGTGLVTFFIAAGIICASLREVLIRGQKINQVNEALQDLMASNSIGKTLQELVQVIASTVEMRDPYTSGHQRRVAELAIAIASKMGLPERNLIGIKLAGLIHDLGKMRVPIEILTKPGQLTELEMSLIREHPKIAHEALKDLQAPWPLADIILQHHERLDGSGYPNQLRGDDILIEARILAVADVVEAMSAMRPYREGLGIGPALAEIKKYSGIKYDPAVVQACTELFDSGEFMWHKALPN